jgi:hypothetical protein
MSSKHDRPETNRKPDPAAPRKRFRIEKLEERIAPKKGGKGTNNCGGGSVHTSSGSGSSGSIY